MEKREVKLLQQKKTMTFKFEQRSRRFGLDSYGRTGGFSLVQAGAREHKQLK